MSKIADIAISLYGVNEPCHCGGAHQVCLNCAVCRAEEDDKLFDPGSGIASIIDATILKAIATQDEVTELCAMANGYKTASVCINSQFIPHIISLLSKEVKSCTVINFPLGASSCAVIEAETEAVLSAGVNEVDMVQNIAAIISGDYKTTYDGVFAAAKLCHAKGSLLKVILETCYLSEEQIIVSCLIAKKAGAEYVKTSTGFGTAGASADSIALMRSVVGPKLGVKASGGIRTREQAQAMIAAGANRIGASSVSALL